MNALLRTRRLSLSTSMRHVLVGTVAVSLLACSSAPSDPPSSAGADTGDLGRVTSPVIKGTNSDASQDDVVLLVHFDPTSNNVGACTGTLLSDKLILTARHCVADTDASAACDANGTPLAQGVVRGNHPANTLYAFVGANRPDFNSGNVTPDGQGAKILDDGGKNLCNHDIALVILKEPIKNAKIAQIRLDSPILKTDVITAIGWGVTDKSPEPAIRQQRSGIKITGIGPDATTPLPLPPNEFQVGESICSGDSGGPALAATNAIVGVVSRGGNNTQPDPNNPSSSCVNGVSDAENIYTKVAPFKKFIVDALASIGAEPWLEGGPDPRLLKPDAVCTDDSQCGSNLCLAPNVLTTDKTCVVGCAADPTACPDGQTCNMVAGGAQICQTAAAAATTNDANASASNSGPKTITKSGCSVAAAPGSMSSSSRSRSSGLFALVLGAVGLAALRRRRSRA
jgi:MYXO-CTERM domain-containing protein